MEEDTYDNDFGFLPSNWLLQYVGIGIIATVVMYLIVGFTPSNPILLLVAFLLVILFMSTIAWVLWELAAPTFVRESKKQ
jgi:hypothetical protein